MGVSPFDKPDMTYDTVAVSIPSLAWPLGWLGITTYGVIGCFFDFIADPISLIPGMAMSLAFFYAALCFWRYRVKQREQWRQARFIEALHKPWPPPMITDWEKFEHDIAALVAKEDRRHRRQLAGSPATPYKKAPPGRSNHGESTHIHFK